MIDSKVLETQAFHVQELRIAEERIPKVFRSAFSPHRFAFFDTGHPGRTGSRVRSQEGPNI